MYFSAESSEDIRCTPTSTTPTVLKTAALKSITNNSSIEIFEDSDLAISSLLDSKFVSNESQLSNSKNGFIITTTTPAVLPLSQSESFLNTTTDSSTNSTLSESLLSIKISPEFSHSNSSKSATHIDSNAISTALTKTSSDALTSTENILLSNTTISKI